MRPLPPALAVTVVALLACGGGDIPTPWSEREGDQDELIAADDPRVGEEARPEARGARPTTTTRHQEPPPPDLPPVAERYPEVEATGQIERCPEGTTKARGGRTEAVFCVLEGTETKHGPYVSLWGNGNTHEVGPYKAGNRHGAWTEWHRSGKVAGTWRWENGEPRGKVTDP